MILFILLIVLWYSCDDWLSRVVNLPWVGDIPPPVVVIVWLIVAALSRR